MYHQSIVNTCINVCSVSYAVYVGSKFMQGI